MLLDVQHFLKAFTMILGSSSNHALMIYWQIFCSSTFLICLVFVNVWSSVPYQSFHLPLAFSSPLTFPSLPLFSAIPVFFFSERCLAASPAHCPYLKILNNTLKYEVFEHPIQVFFMILNCLCQMETPVTCVGPVCRIVFIKYLICCLNVI